METLESTQTQTPETDDDSTVSEEVRREIGDITFGVLYMNKADETAQIIRSID